MSPRVLVLEVGPMATGAARFNSDDSNDTEVVCQGSDGHRAAVEAQEPKPWWVVTTVGQAPRLEPWRLSIFE